MKNIEITIPKNINYLSEYEPLKNGLPKGYLIDKGKVGCGGTTVALEEDDNTIICVPFVSLVHNKVAQYNKDSKVILGVYSGIKDNEIVDYINSKDSKRKIVCTYDQLPRVAKLVGYDWNLLVDELHLLFSQYDFRNKAVKGVLEEFSKFRSWAFLTATPIEMDFMLDELKDIPTYKINWEQSETITVTPVKTKQPLATVKKLIFEFLEGKIFGNAHIFINSVDSIATLIKNCSLNNENCRAIWSKYNNGEAATYINTCKGVKNSDTLSKPKKINFYTSTCFEGCDLYDEDGKIFIVSEGSKAQTNYDIFTSIRQIAGRIRNTQYRNIEHIYSLTRYSEDLTYEEFKAITEKDVDNAKHYTSIVNSDSGLCGFIKECNNPYIYKENGLFVFDPNLLKVDLFNFRNTKSTYSLKVNLFKEYNKINYDIIPKSDSTSDKLLKYNNARTTFKEAVTEYESLVKNPYSLNSDNQRMSLIKEKYPFIDDAIKLGMDKLEELKFNVTNIKRAIINNSNSMGYDLKVAKMLSLEDYSVGDFITGKEIKALLKKAYENLGFNKKVSIEDFRNYMQIEDKRKRVDGKLTRGYVIVRKLTKFIK